MPLFVVHYSSADLLLSTFLACVAIITLQAFVPAQLSRRGIWPLIGSIAAGLAIVGIHFLGTRNVLYELRGGVQPSEIKRSRERNTMTISSGLITFVPTRQDLTYQHPVVSAFAAFSIVFSAVAVLYWDYRHTSKSFEQANLVFIAQVAFTSDGRILTTGDGTLPLQIVKTDGISAVRYDLSRFLETDPQLPTLGCD